MTMKVLDASALLALLLGEPGQAPVGEAVLSGEAMVGTANWAEVVGILVRTGLAARDVKKILMGLQLDVIPLDADLAMAAGLMEAPTKPLGLSLGDRCCLALAEQQRATVLTADRAWLKWKGKAKVVCIR